MNTQKFETFILSNCVRIGDKVAVLVDQEARGWASSLYKHLPDGREGVVIGFDRNIYYVNRNQVYKDKPGTYMSNGCPIVKWNDDGSNDRMSAHHIGPIDQSLIDIRRQDKTYKKAFDTNTYTGPLPSLPYWEGDIIRTKEPIFRNHDEEFQDLVITSIDYYRINEFCNDGVTPMPIYDVRVAGMENSPMTRIRQDDIVEIVERGNYWKHEHGEPLEFKDIQEKLSFYNSIGETKEIRNPRTGNYSWSIDDIIEAIENKTIDYCINRHGLFGAPPMLHAYVIPNHPDIGEEARSMFKLEEFKNM